ncbi:hypothetical protein Y032_0012g1887 [Ancylostoma ceylanicum]|uniref:Uncharacterized protein n=1 Tax=Ancylostoma ceylanicum TaxID=53326 RepID=A0A016VCP6_9BILA|nr:hypothetical protein Y032_0012g1887 [Ancylostoma ceylanicum]
MMTVELCRYSAVFRLDECFSVPFNAFLLYDASVNRCTDPTSLLNSDSRVVDESARSARFTPLPMGFIDYTCTTRMWFYLRRTVH